ncbi:MAG: hypothetical protein D6748_10445, partial [Calditrichaeota bacterium]
MSFPTSFFQKIRGMGLFALLLWGILIARDGEIKFEHISLEVDNSEKLVDAILQDGKGFMWFGTIMGLYRYDGYAATRYSHDAEDSTSLSGNFIRELLEDSDGQIWVGTKENGLNWFNPHSEKFTRILQTPGNKKGLSSNKILSLVLDAEGNIWIGTDGGGLNKLPSAEKYKPSPEIIRYQHNPDIPSSLCDDRVRALYIDSRGRFWVGTNNGFCQFFPATGEFQKIPLNTSQRIYSIIEDRYGKLWIGTYGGVQVFDPDTRTLLNDYQHHTGDPNSLSYNRAISLCEDREGMIWVATHSGGLNRIHPATGRITRFLHDPRVPYSLSYNWLQQIYMDDSGALWIGSTLGIDKVDPGRFKFSNFNTLLKRLDELKEEKIAGIFEDSQGQFWIGTVSGRVKVLDYTHHRAVDVTPQRPVISDFFTQQARSFYEDQYGRIWIGRQSGLDRINRENGIFRWFQSGAYDSKDLYGTVLTMIEDTTGTLWIGTSGGLNHFNEASQTFTHYRPDPQIEYHWKENAVWAMAVDANNQLWLGHSNSGGVSRFDPISKQFTRFLHIPGNNNSLADNTVYSIHVSRHKPGIVWIGTQKGLDRYDSQQNRFIHFTKSDGIPNDPIISIFEDANSLLWLVTVNGVLRFDFQGHQVKVFDKSDGLNDVLPFQNFQSSISGRIYLSNKNGISYFHPDSMVQNEFVPPVYITGLSKYNSDNTEGTPIYVKGITEKDTIDLSYRDKILTFEFTALNYRNTQKNQYAYLLEGFTDNWIHLGTERRLTFTNLDPGIYTLRVKGSNNDGVWNEEGAALRIIIHPPWWKTWWAYTLYVLIIIALIYGFRRSELNRQRLKHQAEMEHLEAEKMHELDRLKSRFFANISHEFRTPLTLIQGPVQQLLSGEFKGNVDEMFHCILRNCSRLLRLVNQLLDISRLENGKVSLQAQKVEVVSLTRQLYMSFESL